MFDSRQARSRHDGELADLNDVVIVARPVTPPAPCTVPAVALVPLRTVGWGQNVALWLRANAIDPDGRVTAALLDEGVTTQGLHVARVTATLLTPKGRRVWDVLAVVPFATISDLPAGYQPLM